MAGEGFWVVILSLRRTLSRVNKSLWRPSFNWQKVLRFAQDDRRLQNIPPLPGLGVDGGGLDFALHDVVGQLQLEVLISRLDAEYKVAAVLEMAPFDTARWLSGDVRLVEEFTSINRTSMAKDRDGKAVFLARSAWDVNYQSERHPDIKFSATRER